MLQKQHNILSNIVIGSMSTKFENSLFYQINLSSKCFNMLFEQFFKELNLGISATEHLALAIIIETQNCCQRDLAKIILKDRANTGKLAGLLEQKGLIKIEATIKNNRAVKILTPTKKGVDLNNKIMEIINPLLKKIKNEISEKIVEETKTALKNIREVVQKNVKINI